MLCSHEWLYVQYLSSSASIMRCIKCHMYAIGSCEKSPTYKDEYARRCAVIEERLLAADRKWGPQRYVGFTSMLREQIRQRDNYRCRICWLRSQRTLHIHRIDYNTNNNDPANLITLCISCHMVTNGNRGYWVKQLEKLQKCRSIQRLWRK